MCIVKKMDDLKKLGNFGFIILRKLLLRISVRELFGGFAAHGKNSDIYSDILILIFCSS